MPFALLADRDVLQQRKREMLFNGEAVQIIHQPTRTPTATVMVFFRRTDVVATGDLFTTVMYPFIDAANGGTINGYIDALNAIIDITVPSNVNEGGTMVIPGHGRLSRRAGRRSSTATWRRSSATASRSTSSAA